jgi:hypothetical protein
MRGTIALLGAGGKMGCRITDNMKDGPDEMLYVEVSETGLANLEARGLAATPQAEAIARADVVVLAVPDALIGRIARKLVPSLKSGAMTIVLDPAAAYAGELPERSDITYFAVHPCHPPIFSDETDPAALHDYFGGIKAKQNIVCALAQGPECDYERGVDIARRMFAPVINAYRVSVEQMAILEPALSETTAATCIVIMREAMEEAIRRGVPADAAEAFLFGHINIALAIVFGKAGNPFSDGALRAIARAKTQIFQPDWKKVFEPEALRQSVDGIVHPD